MLNFIKAFFGFDTKDYNNEVNEEEKLQLPDYWIEDFGNDIFYFRISPYDFPRELAKWRASIREQGKDIVSMTGDSTGRWGDNQGYIVVVKHID